MRKQVSIHLPGSKVDIGTREAPISATILKACISGSGPQTRVEYEVSWFSGRDRKTAWIHPHEIIGGDESFRRIGFHE
jgi:hypothetical protein